MKFFKRIRQTFLKENKLKKYLIYDIGEIILVVIGILIALGANNYNENNKARAQSKEFLKDMVEDLASDTVYLSNMLPTLEKQLSYEDWLINTSTIELSDIDSLKAAVNNVKWTFLINNRSFQNIQNSDGNTLSGYEHLYSAISDYYTIVNNKVVFNNEIEIQKSTTKDAFEEVIYQNLFISTKQYDDYSGFKVGIDLNTPLLVGDFGEIQKSLSEISTKNSLYERYTRHNFQYLTLYFCDLEAKKLIHLIQENL